MLLRNIKSANTPLASEEEKPVSTSRKLFISAIRRLVSRIAIPWGTPFRISVATILSRRKDLSGFISNKEKVFYFNCLIIYLFVHLIMFSLVSLVDISTRLVGIVGIPSSCRFWFLVHYVGQALFCTVYMLLREAVTMGTYISMPMKGHITVTASHVTAINKILAGIPHRKNSPVVNCFEL